MPEPVVLHVAPVSSRHKASGMFHSIPGLLRGLHAEGCKVALLTTAGGLYDERQPYPVFHKTQLGRLPDLRQTPSPFQRPDLVVFHSTYIPKQACLAFQCTRQRVPYIITPRGGMTRGAQAQKRWKKRVGNLLFFSGMVKRAAAIHCLTEVEAEDVRRWGRPVFVVGNGIDLPPPDHTACPGGGTTLRFLFIGRLDIQHKGLDILLKACRLAAGELQAANASLTIYGPTVGRSAEALGEMVDGYGLDGFVRVGGPVFGKEKARAFSSADVFVHTSRFEGHPMAVLEALSYGLPCLLTPGTNMADEVAAAGAGWHADPNPQSVADTLVGIVKSVACLPGMGDRARELAAARYTWGQVACQLTAHYVDIMRVSGQPSGQ